MGHEDFFLLLRGEEIKKIATNHECVIFDISVILEGVLKEFKKQSPRIKNEYSVNPIQETFYTGFCKHSLKNTYLIFLEFVGQDLNCF